MKTFSIIFSFYLLLLAIQPCPDLFSAHEAGDTTSHITLPFGADECPDEERECSPLCNCSCRQMTAFQVLEVRPPDSQNKIARSGVLNTAFQNNYSHQTLNSIWQPPKNNSIA
ncbi:MAG TPA: DUF6660 family protein [Pyrinomonadaceae bacterium]|jgi:hypothetical protein|nr:DUF6660 family protein [Pyrinomonadaceae bacterium]